MLKKILILFALLLCFFSYSQQWEKAKSFNYIFENSLNKHITDKYGNIYVIGEFKSEKVKFDNFIMESNGELDIFIVKLDSSFNVLWAKSFGGKKEDMITGLAIDKLGDIIISGYFTDTILFDNLILHSKGLSDFFISKMDSTGKIIWAKSGGSEFQDYSYSRSGGIAIDYSDNIIVSGMFGYENNIGVPNKRTAYFDSFSVKSYGGQDVFLAKYSINGKLIWINNYGGDGDDIGDVYIQNNFIYLTGGAKANFKFETGQISNSFASPLGYILKIDTMGKVLWAKASFLTNIGSHSINSIVADSVSNTYVLAGFSSSYDAKLLFDNFSIKLPPSENAFYIAKLNSNGKIIWLKNGIGYQNKIVQKSKNHFLLAGSMRSSTSYEGKYLNYSGVNNSVILEIDSNGKPLEFQHFGNSGDNVCDDISLTNNNKLLVTGDNWSGTLTFDSITCQPTDKPASFYIARRNFIAKPVGIEKVIERNPFKIYPNPSSGNFTIELENANKNGFISIYNPLGILIKTLNLNSSNKFYAVDLDVSSGIYFINLIIGENTFGQILSIVN